MDKGYNDLVVIVEDGKHYLTYKGEKLPMQMDTQVTQTTEMALANGSYCQVRVLFHATLKDT